MIHITDSQTDRILAIIDEDEFWDDEPQGHYKSLKDQVETFDFTTFGDREYSQYLTRRNRIVIPDEDGQFIEFVIWNTRKFHDKGGLFVEVYTSASYIDLSKAKVIEPQKLEGQTVSTAVSHAISGTEWEAGTIANVGTRTFEIEEYTNPLAFLKRIATEFDLELHFRVETDGNRVVRRYVDLIERIGTWRGREVEFGKDLMSIERKEDFSNIVTALVGLGPEKEDGTRLTVFVEDHDALQRWGRKNPVTGELMHFVETYEPESTDQDMTEDRLRELTQNELEKRINSLVEYVADPADLEKIVGLEHEKIRLGDTIRIKDMGFNPPLYLEARVHTFRRSIKKNGRKEVTLGDFIEYTEEQVTAIWRSLQREIAKKSQTFEGDTPPIVKRIGDLWYNPASGALFRWSGSAWELVSDVTSRNTAADTAKVGGKPSITVLSDISNAQSAADAAQQAANAAQQAANTANAMLADISSDSKLTPVEKQATKKEWDTIVSEKPTIEAQADTYGITTEKTNYVNAYNALNSYITPLLADLNTTSNIDGKTFRSTFKAYYDARTALLKKITDLAKQKAEQAETNAKSYADSLKQQTDQQIQEVQTNLSNLDQYVDGAFKDGVIQESEAKAIEKYLNQLNTEKADVDTRYNTVYNDANLTGTAKTNLASAKSSYNTAHTNLVNSINSAIADGKVTSTEKSDVDAKFSAYRSALATLSQRFEEAIRAIEQAKATQAEQNAKDYTDQNAVKKGTLYNGVSISDTDGFKVVRSDQLVQGVFNATEGIRFQTRPNTSSSWQDDFYYDVNAKRFKFAGHLEGASGTFGQVTVKNGDFTVQDDASGQQFSVILLPNLIKDHSFETVAYDPNSINTTYRWANAINPYIGGYANSPWYITGLPKVTFQLGPDPDTHLPIFGKQAVCVSSGNYFSQFIRVAPNATYTLSAFVKRQANATSGGTLRFEVWESALLDNKRVRQIAAQTFPAVKSDYTVERRALTFTASLSDPESMIEIVITGGNSYWVQVDGVQLVQADKPSVYNPEDSTFAVIRGDQKIMFEHGRLWSGVLYMNSSQTVYPEKKITDCPNGWILVWSDYDPGVGANDFHWVFNYIPKGFITSVFGSGQGVLVPTPHVNNTPTNAKYIYVFDDRISGNDDNQASPLNDVCLRYVLEW